LMTRSTRDRIANIELDSTSEDRHYQRMFAQSQRMFGLPLPAAAPANVWRDGELRIVQAFERFRDDGDEKHLVDFRQWVADVHARYGGA